MKLVLATHNLGKIKEMKEILGDLGIEILSAEEAGVKEDVEEDGKTFEENALKKARFVFQKLNPPYSPFAKGGELNSPPNLPLYKRGRRGGGFWVAADDSGICIESLGGFPGVYSARWLGENTDGEDLSMGLLKKMSPCGRSPEGRRGISQGKREAYFQCVIALVAPRRDSVSRGDRVSLSKNYWIFGGKVNGQIAEELRGKSRPKLPYDLVFIPDGHNKTFAEMPDAEKNKISHRGLALKKLKDFFENNKTLLEKY